MAQEFDAGVTCGRCGRELPIRRTDPLFAKLRGNVVKLANGARALEFTLPNGCPDCGASAVHVALRR